MIVSINIEDLILSNAVNNEVARLGNQVISNLKKNGININFDYEEIINQINRKEELSFTIISLNINKFPNHFFWNQILTNKLNDCTFEQKELPQDIIKCNADEKVEILNAIKTKLALIVNKDNSSLNEEKITYYDHMIDAICFHILKLLLFYISDYELNLMIGLGVFK